MQPSQESKPSVEKSFFARFLTIVGYLVPLVQSIPAWTGLMTLPFASYLILMFANLPVNLPRALMDFLTPFQILEKACVVIGLVLLIVAISYQVLHRKRELILSGPYRWVRHPQYLGMILITLGFTSWSVWILNNTFGIGFLSASQTIGVWFLELLAYLFLAYLEEQALTRQFGVVYASYQRQTPFLIPLLKLQKKELTLLSSILILACLLFGLLVS
jgi:protein-S-isoprenylcysteine O-methyltransferase Ste14